VVEGEQGNGQGKGMKKSESPKYRATVPFRSILLAKTDEHFDDRWTSIGCKASKKKVGGKIDCGTNVPLGPLSAFVTTREGKKEPGE